MAASSRWATRPRAAPCAPSMRKAGSRSGSHRSSASRAATTRARAARRPWTATPSMRSGNSATSSASKLRPARSAGAKISEPTSGGNIPAGTTPSPRSWMAISSSSPPAEKRAQSWRSTKRPARCSGRARSSRMARNIPRSSPRTSMAYINTSSSPPRASQEWTPRAASCCGARSAKARRRSSPRRSMRTTKSM